MSLVVAGYENKSMVIVSDTKLTYPNYMHNSLKNHINSGTIEHGILKLVVVSEKICVAFAGEVEYAENAIKEINPDASIQYIQRVLEENHQKSAGKTDFILCSNLGQQIIHVIKDGKIEVAGQAWIGDKIAFERFQEGRIGGKKSIASALDDVISDETITTVGGFNVSVGIDSGKFSFGFSMKVSREPMIATITAGKPYLIGHGTAENGAYTLTFIGSSANYQHVAFHIKQGNIGVVYSRKENGLLRPEIKPNIDEVDFHDYIIREFEIYPSISTQDRFQKFFSDGKSCYLKRDFLNATKLFYRAKAEGKGKQKCEALFYIGVCFHYLKNPQAASIFNELISIDSSYQRRIMSFLAGK